MLGSQLAAAEGRGCNSDLLVLAVWRWCIGLVVWTALVEQSWSAKVGVVALLCGLGITADFR